MKLKQHILYLSNSSVNTKRACARRLMYRKLMRVQNMIEINYEARENSWAGDVGNALHPAIQSYYVHGDYDKALWELIRHFPIQYAQQTWSNERSLQACIASFDYIRARIDIDRNRYKIAYLPNGKPAIEVPFLIQLYDNNNKPFIIQWPNAGVEFIVVYIGYIDMILWDQQEQDFVTNDIKTTTKRFNDFTPMYRFDEQCLPYSFVLHSMLTGSSKLKLIRQTVKSLDIIYTVLVINLLNPEAQFIPIIRPYNDVKEWVHKLTLEIADIKLWCETNWFPHTGKSCMSFNRICPWYNLCIGSESDELSTNPYLLENIAALPINQYPSFNPAFSLSLTVSSS